jgi:hypothetical protein
MRALCHIATVANYRHEFFAGAYRRQRHQCEASSATMRDEIADACAVRASFQSSTKKSDMQISNMENLTQYPALKCEIASKF